MLSRVVVNALIEINAYYYTHTHSHTATHTLANASASQQSVKCLCHYCSLFSSNETYLSSVGQFEKSPAASKESDPFKRSQDPPQEGARH